MHHTLEYQEGYEAFNDGWDDTFNPYTKTGHTIEDQQRAEDWHAGWQAAKEEQ